VTSKRFVSTREGADPLVLLFVMEDGAEDAVDRGAVGEGAHRPISSPDFARVVLDGVVA
jgi:hypothetical protein